jgi:apolipoprotein N-acyltransferase
MPRLVLSDLPHRIVLSWGWRRAAIALLAGAASALAMPPFNIFPILAVTLPIVVWLIDGTDAAGGRIAGIAASGWIGWCFGFGYFVAGLWWIGAAFLVDADDFAWLMPAAVVALPAGLALFYAGGLALARLMWPVGAARILVLALALGGAEWLRGHVLTGFPWNSLGYALADNAWLGQAAAVIGMEGLTPVAIAVFAAPATLIDAGLARRRWVPSALAVLVLAALAGYGAHRLGSDGNAAVAGVNVRIVQPAIAEIDKLKAVRKADIVDRYLALSRQTTGPNRRGMADVSLLVWPESAFPFFLERAPAVLQEIGDLLPATATLITGAARADTSAPGSPKFYNSMRVIAGDGSIVGTYDKVHLVPFGEFLPWQSMLNAIGLHTLTRKVGGFSAGAGRTTLLLPNGLKVAPMICYEAIFPRAAVDRSDRPDMLVNVTNDAWFGDTPGPYQHLAQARVRAIEEGLPLLRAANTGISAVIDPYGRVAAELPLGAAGVLDAVLPVRLPPTFYGRHGPFIVAGLYIFLALTAFAGLRRRI